MIWPEQGLLRAGGESFVIDAYSQGAMYSMTEVSTTVMLFLMCLHDSPGSRRMDDRTATCPVESNTCSNNMFAGAVNKCSCATPTVTTAVSQCDPI